MEGMTRLAAETLERIRTAWADEMGVPDDAFAERGVHAFPQEDASSVVALDLDGVQVLVGPRPALDLLDWDEPQDAWEMDRIVAALESLDPDPVGVATLAYADRVEVPQGVEVALGPIQNVDLLLEQCTEDEREESGIEQMPARIAARRPDGKVAAVAGYERWGPQIAHLGVLAAPAWRKQGYAAAAAARAAQVAQNEELVPQWRSRVGNTASDELADRLGFHCIGRQLAVVLGRS